VTRLALLAVLILAMVVLAGDPPCPLAKVSGPNPLVQNIDVGPSATITITFDAAQWGIPKLGSRLALRTPGSPDTLTVAADPQPSDGKWSLLVMVTYIEQYRLEVKTYTINCSGNIMTWTSVKKVWEKPAVTKTLINLTDQPLTLWYKNSWTVNVAPPINEVVSGANEYDPSPPYPVNEVAITYIINGADKQLSGLSPSTSSNPSWNFGENVASYVPESLQLVFLNGRPPAAETYGQFGGRCSGSGPPVGDSSYSESITCTSYGSIDIKITAGLRDWVQHTLKFWSFAGIAGYLENFLYEIGPGYVRLYQNDKGYVPIPCKPPFNATKLAEVTNPPSGKMEALSAALWKLIGGQELPDSAPWSALMTYGKIDKTDVCYTGGGVEAGVVYVWRYKADLAGDVWINVDTANHHVAGNGEVAPYIPVWLPQGGVYKPTTVDFGGQFAGLDGQWRQIQYSDPYGWRRDPFDANVLATGVPCPPSAVADANNKICIMTYDVAWDGRQVELGTNYYGNQRTVFHWEYPSYGGGEPLYWVGWHSRAILYSYGGSWGIKYVSMSPGWRPIVITLDPSMPDSQTSLTGYTTTTFYLRYDVTRDVAKYKRNWQCFANDYGTSPPVMALDTCLALSLNADVSLAHGAQPVYLPPGNGTDLPPPPPPNGNNTNTNSTNNNNNGNKTIVIDGKPPQPLGDCVMVQPALASLAQGAYAFNPRIYATAPFHVVWPGAPFVLVVGVPYSANCPSTLTAAIRVYAHHMRKDFTGFINTTLTLSKGQWYYVGPSGAKPFTKGAMCGQFADTGLDDWYNALQKPGIYTIIVEYDGKVQYFYYEVRPVKLVWESYVPYYTSINIPTGIVAVWMQYVNTSTITMAQWWPYGAGRGGLASRYYCGAIYWSEDLPGEFAFSTHFGDLVKAKVQYVDLTPKVSYTPGKGVELSINVPTPPKTVKFVITWYIYVNRGGAWKLVGYVSNNSPKLVIPQADVPVWPWDPVMIVPAVDVRGEGDPIYHYKPGYALFFNFWSLPLANPPPQSDPAALVRLLGGVVVGP